MLIAIEGIDGCGKTTVGKLVAERLGCELLHFPEDNAVTGPAIRGYLRGEWSVREGRSRGGWFEPRPEIGAMAFQALQVVNRLEHCPKLQTSALSVRNHLVLSRYTASSVVYGAHDGLDPEWLARINETLPRPDLWVYLRCSPETALARRAARDGEKSPELYEGQLGRSRDLAGRFDEYFRDGHGPTTGTLMLDAASTHPEQLVSNVIARARALGAKWDGR